MTDGWDCPYCNRVATLSRENVSQNSFAFTNNNKLGTLHMGIKAVTCPNPACREVAITARLSHAIRTPNGFEGGTGIQAWQLRPQSAAKTFPDYIPAALREDYSEACLIRDLSPKASATLSRRCLQGMIRNFWTVKAPNLYQEINAIKDKVDPATWEAIDAVRSIGNIGAHMEKDINLVIDVDPDEAQTLIQLIEMLFEEWYIRRNQREERLASIVAIANAKNAAKAPKPTGGSVSSPPEIA